MMGSEETETFRESDNGHDRGMRTETDARGNGHVSGRTGSEKSASGRDSGTKTGGMAAIGPAKSSLSVNGCRECRGLRLVVWVRPPLLSCMRVLT